MKRPSLGDQELELLRYINERKASLSVRKTVEQYGEPRGLARTTVLTMLERLRKKGYLSRMEVEGVNYYSTEIPQHILLQDMVRSFVETKLSGSISPFMAYLAQKEEMNPEELQELKELVRELERKQGVDGNE